MIPLKIHQIWMNPKENGEISYPDRKTKSYMEIWENEFEQYKLWNDMEMLKYIKLKDAVFYEKYVKLPRWINRCDAFRYFLLYHEGGIYVDCDVILRDKAYLIKLLGNRKNLFLTYDFPLFHFKNHFFACMRGDDIMKKCYENISTDDKNSLKIAGPIYLSNILVNEDNKKFESVNLLSTGKAMVHVYNNSWVTSEYHYIHMVIFIVVIIIMVGFVMYLVDLEYLEIFFPVFGNIGITD